MQYRVGWLGSNIYVVTNKLNLNFSLVFCKFLIVIFCMFFLIFIDSKLVNKLLYLWLKLQFS